MAIRVRNQRTSQDLPNYNIVEIDQNTEKSPRDLRRLYVSQTSVRDHQLTLLLKIRTEYNNNNNNMYNEDNGLNSLFNVISNFVKFLTPKPPLEKSSCDTV